MLLEAIKIRSLWKPLTATCYCSKNLPAETSCGESGRKVKVAF